MNRYIEFDVMDGDKYLVTMRYPHKGLFEVTDSEIMEYVYQKRPSFRKKRNLHIEFCEKHKCNIRTIVKIKEKKGSIWK